MTFSSLIRHLQTLPLNKDLQKKLQQHRQLSLSGLPRLPKGLIVSSLAQALEQNLFVIAATQEEAGRWTAQLELMSWQTVNFYPTSEASPYESSPLESEMVWGQMQVLAELSQGKTVQGKAIVATEKALQAHLPPPEIFQQYCLTLTKGSEVEDKTLELSLAQLGYEREPSVEVEGQWSRRGDIVDIFPVSAELPLRLEWFGDELETVREFDPASQRSLDEVTGLVLTPTSFDQMIESTLTAQNIDLADWGEDAETEQLFGKEGLQRFSGLAFSPAASLLAYLPPATLCVLDEAEQCLAHSERWEESVEQDWRSLQLPALPKIHQAFPELVAGLQERFNCITLSEIYEAHSNSLDISARPIPTMPHQFAKLAEILRGKREIYTGMNLTQYNAWLVSAQPSRTVSLLQEHDYAAQFIANPKDYPAIEKSQIQQTAVALKYAGIAELEGFILPTFRVVLITDRELFGQHALATPEYVRKRRRAKSKQVDINKLSPGDFVVHKSHGIGKFLKLESLATREYLVIQYADGTLRVPADSLDSLSRYRHTGSTPPQLHKMGGKIWEATKKKVRKAVKKLAVDLLNLYAKRAKQEGYAYPPDTPWQLELEDSFPYQPTPDQLKARRT